MIQMSPTEIAELLFDIGLKAAKLFSVDFDEIMAELNKRHTIDGSASDAAAAEMDSHLVRERADEPEIPRNLPGPPEPPAGASER